jgi:hypothetical protein
MQALLCGCSVPMQPEPVSAPPWQAPPLTSAERHAAVEQGPLHAHIVGSARGDDSNELALEKLVLRAGGKHRCEGAVGWQFRMWPAPAGCIAMQPPQGLGCGSSAAGLPLFGGFIALQQQIQRQGQRLALAPHPIKGEVVDHPPPAGDQQAGPVVLEHQPVLAPRATALHLRRGTPGCGRRQGGWV